MFSLFSYETHVVAAIMLEQQLAAPQTGSKR